MTKERKKTKPRGTELRRRSNQAPSSQRLKGVDVEGREDAFVDGDKVE